MLGTIVNTVAIIIGAIIGTLLHKGIPNRPKETIMKAISLAVILMGLKSALQSEQLLLLISSMLVGSIIGEALNIERRIERLGTIIELKVGADKGEVAKGFVTSSLIFCIGSMAIVGAIQSGLTGNHEMLFAKSMLDGVTSIILASTMGIGVMFSGVMVFIYEGAITLSASLFKDALTDEVIREMSAVGGLLIMAIGLNFLEINKIRVANMLPAIFIPVIYLLSVAKFAG